MDYRQKDFLAKFKDASKYLGISQNELISLKIRENSNHQEYKVLLDDLEKSGLSITPIDGSLQGNGYLVADSDSKVIIVEHETGLEILLSDLGSIASLLSLPAAILFYWEKTKSVRDRFMHRFNDDRGIESRKLDNKGQLIEEILPRSYFQMKALFNANNEISQLKNEVKNLNSRLDLLEKKISKQTKKVKK
ncbi:MAG: hypothetical protein WCV67_02425 [Victivallaceae bacterium]|jgi:hypothetical protein